jgi:hypothetical protein
VEVAEAANQLDQLDGVFQPRRMLDPLVVNSALRVAAQPEHVRDAAVGESSYQSAQLRDAVANRRHVRDRQQRGVARQPADDADGAVTGGPTRAVGA